MNDFKLPNLPPNGYQPQAIDTSIEADLIQFSLLRHNWEEILKRLS